MIFLRRIQIFCITFVLGISVSSTQAWILILNGTSSSGKTTITRNLQKLMAQPAEILQFDVEASQLLKEELEKIGYHYDGTTNINDWIDSLPKKVVERLDGDTGWKKVQMRIIEKAQALGNIGTNVIIDTGLKNEEDYNLFALGLHSHKTYFVLLYASIVHLLKNVMKRNNSGNSDEKRNPLGPFFQYFFLLANRCEVTSPEKLDVLTKKDFEDVFKQLEILIKSKDEFDEYWVQTKDFKKIKSIIDRMFFHTCWKGVPYYIRHWLPCCCRGKAVIGITSKLPHIHDLVINTGSSSPIESANILYDWISAKI